MHFCPPALILMSRLILTSRGCWYQQSDSSWLRRTWSPKHSSRPRLQIVPSTTSKPQDPTHPCSHITRTTRSDEHSGHSLSVLSRNTHAHTHSSSCLPAKRVNNWWFHLLCFHRHPLGIFYSEMGGIGPLWLVLFVTSLNTSIILHVVKI